MPFDIRRTRAVLLAGPTASGKTSLAIAIAQRVGLSRCVIINADAMQVYDTVRIITARPTPEQESLVPHRLFGTISPAIRFSAGAWLKAVQSQLANANLSRLLPILVGGTGLYFRTLVQGLASIPDVDERIVNRWQRQVGKIQAPGLHRILLERDPRAAKVIHPHDAQRIIRALSVLDATGSSLVDWWEKPSGKPILNVHECKTCILEPEPGWLRTRISLRIKEMLDSGALEEVRFLKNLKLDDSTPIMRAVGVRELSDHLAGKIDLDLAVERIQNATWHYAKRQRTWFRHQMPGWERLGCESGCEPMVERIGFMQELE